MGSAVHAGAQISMPELNLHAGAQISMPELNLHAGAQSPCRNSNLHTGAQSRCRSSNLHAGAQSTALSESGTDKEVSSVYETPYDCFAFRGQMVSTKAIVANCSSSRKAMSVHAHGKPRRPEDGRNQMQSDAIRCNHMQSDAIRDGLLFLAHLRMRSRPAARAFGPAKRKRPSEGRGPPRPPPHIPHRRASYHP